MNDSSNTINRSMLIAAAEVLKLFNDEDSDSVAMAEARRLAFEKLPQENMLKVLDYFKSPSDYIVNEDVEPK